MKRLLAHVNTKNELTEYLARKTLEKGRQDGLRVVVVWSSSCRESHRDMAYLDSNQEEADTKLLLHATCINATTSGATSITRRRRVCARPQALSRSVRKYLLCHRKRLAQSKDPTQSNRACSWASQNVRTTRISLVERS